MHRSACYCMLCLFFMFLLLGTLSAEDADDFTLSVIGYGKVKKSPDTAIVTLFVFSDGKNLQLANDDVTKKSTQIIDKLKSSYPDIKSIEAETLHIGEKQADYIRPGMDGYVPVVPIIIIKLTIMLPPDPATAFNIVDTAVENGASIELSRYRYNLTRGMKKVIEYSLEAYENAEKEALEQAIVDAKQQAEKTAKMAGVKLGNLISVGSSSENKWENYYGNPWTRSIGGVSPYSSLNPKEIEVSQTIILQYSFEQ